MNTYVCDRCKRTLQNSRSHEDKMKEYHDNFDGVVDPETDEMVTICDPCYQSIMAHTNYLNMSLDERIAFRDRQIIRKKVGKMREEMNINQAGLDLIKHFEGCRLKAYKCPGGKWTIGYGHTYGVKEGDICTYINANEFLEDDIYFFARGVTDILAHLDIEATENEFSAMICFVFNLRNGLIILTRILENVGLKGYPEEIQKYIYADRKLLSGLKDRREAEKELFLKEV